ncbi:MAG: Asp-tRNA(Asn)/Glu-tRNA(Gln) amidotransferase subunit GatA [Clostridiales bacterium]|nr:Asp-tRNA(Asn)/Glu-tRNA(Gln) amidotransferase subunit GatA [Clostridiales bacterium]
MDRKEMTSLGIIDTLDALKSKKFTCVELVEAYLENIKQFWDKNAVLEVFDDVLDHAREVDEKIAQGKLDGKLLGVPFIIKDNILYKGKRATCASKFLEKFVSPYNATVVEKLLNEGAVILGRANMDEFAMGGSTEKSAYGPCKNAHDDERVSGGSSGGSAVAVACNLCAAALGTDTGGSVRQPASFNGVVGMKPTYGRISRYGVVAFASSLDQVGPMTKNVKDNAYLLEILAGADIHDQTTRIEAVDDYTTKMDNVSIKGMKIGYCKELIDMFKQSKDAHTFDRAIEFFKNNGAEIVEVTIPHIELALPVYYILAPAEATSNLGRFDGVKYTTREGNSSDINKLYVESRTKGFGKEVKRRILLGNYVLSSGFFDAFYQKAQKVQRYLTYRFEDALSQCDVLLMPVAYGEAFKIGEKTSDPVTMYLEDMFTVPSNLVGIPSLSVPYEVGSNGLPIGLQILGRKLDESTMYGVAQFVEKNYKRID